jgi:hypothetical protein
MFTTALSHLQFLNKLYSPLKTIAVMKALRISKPASHPASLVTIRYLDVVC